MAEIGLLHAAVVLQRAHRRHHDDRVRAKPRHAALDIEELLRAEIRAEAGLRHAVVAELARDLRGRHAVAAVRNVRKGAAVHKGGRALERLHEVRLERVLQQRRHRALRLQIAGGHGLSVVGVAHDDARELRLQIHHVAGEAQHRHDLARHRDVKAVLARHAVGLAAETGHDVSQLPVVHVHRAAPGDPARVDAEHIALLNVVVQHRREQVVRRADGVEVAGEVEVDVLHRHHLRIAAAGGAALDAEHGAQRRLAQRDDDVLADAAQRVAQTDRRGRLALARGGGSDRRHEDELAVRRVRLVLQQLVVHLGLVAAVLLQIRLVHAGALRHRGDRLHLTGLCDFNVGFVLHVGPPFKKCRPYYSMDAVRQKYTIPTRKNALRAVSGAKCLNRVSFGPSAEAAPS